MKKQILTAVICLAFIMTTQAQKLTDSNHTYRIQLADQYMQKSRTGKAIGYGLLAGGAATLAIGISQEMNDNSSEGLAFLGFVAMAISNPILCGASRNKGKAEMLYMDPITGEKKEALIKNYRGNATTSSIAAWTLFLGGFAGLFVAADSESDGVLIASSAAMFASLPIWMNAAKNKGRLRILTGKEEIPGNPAGPSSYRSFGLGIPIGK